jgi:alanine-alpha-ketoisovalerate/valine-pyruvate aminotransferase
MTTSSLLADMLESGKALDALCNYDGPQGKSELLALLARCCVTSWAGRSNHRILH